ncbi:ferrous iron transport protein B [Methylocystis echinoides]|uniref:Ferrous iron transport protein B n=1 Tax=Methylocystis echinoides TaxID=29468 RepID=A0A9W6GXC5_9HYPH|nr:ferrous iron transport protein B [Methylocystis echinoides]GLI94813.1 ferrous iron transport protein B [Methylocystis echinoides]
MTSNESVLRIALAGQPNVGKSTIFNALTGLNQHVGNWPGKTVERKEGAILFRGRRIEIVDLPGAYGLTASSEEERIARDYIIKNRLDGVILIANAAAIDRNLYLLAELLALPVPVTLGLNMMDVAAAEGVDIMPVVLEANLGLPVTPVTAVADVGVSDLLSSAVAQADDRVNSRPARPQLSADLQRCVNRIRKQIDKHTPRPYDAEWVALKLLEGDAEIVALVREWLPEPDWRQVEAILATKEDAALEIVGGRYLWVDRLVKSAVRRAPRGAASLTERIDWLVLHPIAGMAILLLVLGLTFTLTFVVAWPLQRLLETRVILPLRDLAATSLSSAPPALSHFIADAVLGGAGLVLTFLPLLLVFYAIFGFLEDTGYLARIAYLTDRFMQRIGLHGKSFLPFCMGFGCNVPAIMGARVIESPAGRLLTILLAPLVPCSARFAVLAFLAPVFFGANALWVSMGLVMLNIAVLAVLGAILSLTLFRNERVSFVMELPLYHAPNPRTIGLFTWGHSWSFLRRASSMILAVSTGVWLLAYFPHGALETSWLAQLGHMLEPVGRLLGLDWRLTVALMTSFVAKENAIATLGVIYGAEGGSLASALAHSVTIPAGLSFLVTTMLFIPCAATVSAIRQETASWTWTLFSVGMLLLVAVIGGALAYHAALWFLA